MHDRTSLDGSRLGSALVDGRAAAGRVTTAAAPPLLDWSRYRMKADVVIREVVALRAFPFASLTFPPISAEDFALLRESVEVNGVQEPLTVTPDGAVVDGRERLRAAVETGLDQVPTRTLEVAGGEPDYALWATVVNLGRRHLSAGERLAIVRTLLALLEGQARVRQIASRFGEHPPAEAEAASANSDAPAARLDVRRQLGLMLNVSRSQAAKLVHLAKHASEELCGEVLAGRISIHRAYRVAMAGTIHVDTTPAARATRIRLRRELRTDPVRALRVFAVLIVESVADLVTTRPEIRREVLASLQSLIDSCELGARRLAG